MCLNFIEFGSSEHQAGTTKGLVFSRLLKIGVGFNANIKIIDYPAVYY